MIVTEFKKAFHCRGGCQRLSWYFVTYDASILSAAFLTSMESNDDPELKK